MSGSEDGLNHKVSKAPVAHHMVSNLPVACLAVYLLMGPLAKGWHVGVDCHI